MLEDLHPDLCLSCLAERGSFSSSRSRPQFFEGENKTYSPADLRDLVRYAESRGVQIVPEIDVPSHSL
jgi:N-acetyl-beta-hexosaminidase